MTVLRLDAISLRRGGVPILSDISLRIEPGHQWAILGPNGSGKTTLLKVVTGYEWPSLGSVEALGHRYGQVNLPQLRKRIGWVSSSLLHRQSEALTALQVVLSGLEATIGLHREFTPVELDRARSALDLLGANGWTDRPFSLLSQGEQQRTLIARGLVSDPALLILDEPCAGLDPAARETFLSDLARLVAHPALPTVLFVTHHVEEIAPWITHVLLLRAGRSVAQGTAAEVLTSENFTAMLDRPCEVAHRDGRYSLFLPPIE